MSPNEAEFIVARIADLSTDLAGLTTEVRTIDSKLSKALYGGNGEKEGIYERLRLLLRWKSDHSRSHEEQNVERRRKGENIRSITYSFAKDVAKLVVSALIAYALYQASGGKIVGIQ